ncbi:hypothetical protein GE09DRAFT_1120139 [Coniochaeta sp. 2T2.1]|nr:hypothetical protein GE09DRAFT_1120139 [Coniochaeta sp. 2T2.1]
MRFAAVALFAGAVMAESIQSTVSTTEYFTVTSCGPTVTDCPASSTVTKSSVYPLTTSTVYATTVKTITSCAPTVTNCPAHSTVVVTETNAISTTVCPVIPSSSTKIYSNTTTPAGPPASVQPSYSQTAVLTTTKAPACPTYSVKTISTSVTTVVPTVIYETVAIPCPTTASPSAGFPTAPSNGTVTKPPVATVTAGAATLGNSLFVVAAAGLAAVVFA